MKQLIKRLIPRKLRPDSIVIPVIHLNGAIMPGASPLRSALNLASCASSLDKAFSLKKSPAVAISINSPGGSPVQSRLIFRRIRDLADEKKKTVLVYIEDVAASGGYMIAIAGDEIIADPSSIVGSIGVISASFGFTEMIRKIGIERRVYTAGQNKSTLDPFMPEKKADIEKLKKLQLEIHQTFIDLVKTRRGDKLPDNPELFTGAFWTGSRGLELGLVDKLGDMRSDLRARYGDKVELKSMTPPRGLLMRRFGRMAAQAAGGIADAANERALWSRYGL